MGCCVSTLDDNKKHSLKKDKHFSCESKSPPILEEESVKEVLSETPKSKPKPKPGSETGIKASNNNVEQPTRCRPFLEQKLPHYEQKLTSMEQKLIPMKQNKYYPDPTTTPEAEEEQISEVCSLNESISTTTLEDHHMQLPNYTLTSTTTAGDFPHRVMYRSQGQNSHFLPKNNYHNNHGHGRSPARRADPSPPRRNSPGRVGPRRDVVGENSARRSRSPATRSNVGRSPSARRAGASPGRVRMVNGPGPGPEEVRRERDANVDEWAGLEESLENPLVSLECFIFL